jgi:hypothetical protein
MNKRRGRPWNYIQPKVLECPKFRFNGNYINKACCEILKESSLRGHCGMCGGIA